MHRMPYLVPAASRALPLILTFFLACSASFSTQAYEVSVSAPAALKDLLTEHLDVVRFSSRTDINADQLNFMIATVSEQVVQLASTEGFFSPVTTVQTDHAGDTTTIRINVDPGPRTVVSAVDVQVEGAAQSQSLAQVDAVRQRWSMHSGQAFRQEEWAAAKQDGLQMLQELRYPSARIADSQARILADAHVAELAVTYDSGPLFTLGALKVSGTQRYPASIVYNVNPLSVGEEYSTARLLELQRQILKTPYFSNVVIDIARDTDHATEAPVNVQVTEYPTQRVRGSMGYTTDGGAHVGGLYSHNNVLGRAWVFDGKLDIDERRQQGSVQLALPPAPGGTVDSLHGSFERTAVEGIDLRSQRLGLRRAHSTDTRDTAYSLEYYSDQLEQIDGATPPPETFVQPGTHQALVFGTDRSWRAVDNLVFPRKGHVISLEGGVAFKGVLSDQTFVRLHAKLHEYVPMGKRDVIVLRADGGAVWSTGDNAAIPASLLFRAGGTESIRGYDFQSIGNERNGTVYPARYLAAASAEYQHWLSADWGGAAFYDVGTAADTWQDKSLFHAVGVGVRWRSPVGTVRLDIAYGFQKKQIRPHLSFGVAF
ncbi:MAG: autotransporter assembly complex family protein [Rhodoferax sp.]